MIAKHILRKPGNDNVRALGAYIADASHEGEKCLLSWHTGCLSENYQDALIEIEAVQALNARTTKEKTYHLVISFHPEDEAKLTPAAFQEIEEEFARTLGFAQHQRLCGVHKNTNNLHLHIAYNMIDPERFTRKEPFRDYNKLSEACRAMEKQFNLAIDLGMEAHQDKNRNRIDQRAAAMEAHSGEQSFQTYALGCKEAILERMQRVTTWKEMHQLLADHGIGVRERGNGLVLVNLQGKGTMKASGLDRSLAKAKMVTRFGAFITAEPGSGRLGHEEKTRKPLQPRSPGRDQLYKDYRALIQEKIARIDAEKARQQTAYEQLNKQWARAKEILERETYSRKALFKQLGLLKSDRKESLACARVDFQQRLKAIKKEYPWHNWNGYLKHQAEHGNKVALEVLRSRPKTCTAATTTAMSSDDYLLAKEKATLAIARHEKKMLESAATAGQRQTITAISRMALLAAQEKLRIKAGQQSTGLFTAYSQVIDNRGVVIFTLAGGGTIRDSGRQVYFSPDPVTQKAAQCYALSKFGKSMNIQGNTIERRKYERRTKTIKPHLGILRESARYGLRTLSKLAVVLGKKQTKVLLQDHAHDDLER